jgi:hypothetical protein
MHTTHNVGQSKKNICTLLQVWHETTYVVGQWASQPTLIPINLVLWNGLTQVRVNHLGCPELSLHLAKLEELKNQ